VAIVVPYVPGLQWNATEVWSHARTDTTWVDVSGDVWAYPDLLAEKWQAGATFVVVEQDVVPWPGAIEALLGCDQPWCAYGYLPPDVNNGRTTKGNRTVPFGCVKFADQFIRALPDAWTVMRGWAEEYIGSRPPWSMCDAYLEVYAGENGVSCHQHFPSVFELNTHTSYPTRCMTPSLRNYLVGRGVDLSEADGQSMSLDLERI
jgi:hypothetical protein